VLRGFELLFPYRSGLIGSIMMPWIFSVAKSVELHADSVEEISSRGRSHCNRIGSGPCDDNRFCLRCSGATLRGAAEESPGS